MNLAHAISVTARSIPFGAYAPGEFRHSIPERELFSSLRELMGSRTKKAGY